ncbi:MAG: response regulator, partial [Candidatus Omnitrophota bacterium]
PAKSNIESGRLFIDPRLGYGEFACVRYKDIPLVQGKIPGEHPVYHFGTGPNFKVFFGQNGLEIENINVRGYKPIWKPQEREFSLISKGLDGEDVPEKDFDFQRGSCHLDLQREISLKCRPRPKTDICASPISQSFYNSIMLVFFPLLLALYLFRLNTSPPGELPVKPVRRRGCYAQCLLLIPATSSLCSSSPAVPVDLAFLIAAVIVSGLLGYYTYMILHKPLGRNWKQNRGLFVSGARYRLTAFQDESSMQLISLNDISTEFCIKVNSTISSSSIAEELLLMPLSAWGLPLFLSPDKVRAPLAPHPLLILSAYAGYQIIFFFCCHKTFFKESAKRVFISIGKEKNASSSSITKTFIVEDYFFRRFRNSFGVMIGILWMVFIVSRSLSPVTIILALAVMAVSKIILFLISRQISIFIFGLKNRACVFMKDKMSSFSSLLISRENFSLFRTNSISSKISSLIVKVKSLFFKDSNNFRQVPSVSSPETTMLASMTARIEFFPGFSYFSRDIFRRNFVFFPALVNIGKNTVYTPAPGFLFELSKKGNLIFNWHLPYQILSFFYIQFKTNFTHRLHLLFAKLTIPFLRNYVKSSPKDRQLKPVSANKYSSSSSILDANPESTPALSSSNPGKIRGHLINNSLPEIFQLSELFPEFFRIKFRVIDKIDAIGSSPISENNKKRLKISEYSITVLGQQPAGKTILKPAAMAVHKGKVYVLDGDVGLKIFDIAVNQRIELEFSSAFDYWAIEIDGLSEIKGIVFLKDISVLPALSASNSDMMVIAGINYCCWRHYVSYFNNKGQRVLGEFCKKGSIDDICINSNGYMCLLDSRQNIIRIDKPTDPLSYDFDIRGEENALCIASDSDSNIYIGYGSGRVERYNKEGDFDKSWVIEKAGKLITDIEVDNKGNIYVLDGIEAVASKFDKKGYFLETIGKGVLRQPLEIKIFDKSIFILDTVLNDILIFKPKNARSSPIFSLVKKRTLLFFSSPIFDSIYIQIIASSGLIRGQPFLVSNKEYISSPIVNSPLVTYFLSIFIVLIPSTLFLIAVYPTLRFDSKNKFWSIFRKLIVGAVLLSSGSVILKNSFMILYILSGKSLLNLGLGLLITGIIIGAGLAGILKYIIRIRERIIEMEEFTAYITGFCLGISIEGVEFLGSVVYFITADTLAVNKIKVKECDCSQDRVFDFLLGLAKEFKVSWIKMDLDFSRIDWLSKEFDVEIKCGCISDRDIYLSLNSIKKITPPISLVESLTGKAVKKIARKKSPILIECRIHIMSSPRKFQIIKHYVSGTVSLVSSPLKFPIDLSLFFIAAVISGLFGYCTYMVFHSPPGGSWKQARKVIEDEISQNPWETVRLNYERKDRNANLNRILSLAVVFMFASAAGYLRYKLTVSYEFFYAFITFFGWGHFSGIYIAYRKMYKILDDAGKKQASSSISISQVSLENEIWAKFPDLATTNPKAIRLIKKILQEAYNTGSYIFLFHNPHDSCFIKVEKDPFSASPVKNSIFGGLKKFPFIIYEAVAFFGAFLGDMRVRLKGLFSFNRRGGMCLVEGFKVIELSDTASPEEILMIAKQGKGVFIDSLTINYSSWLNRSAGPLNSDTIPVLFAEGEICNGWLCTANNVPINKIINGIAVEYGIGSMLVVICNEDNGGRLGQVNIDVIYPTGWCFMDPKNIPIRVDVVGGDWVSVKAVEKGTLLFSLSKEKNSSPLRIPVSAVSADTRYSSSPILDGHGVYRITDESDPLYKVSWDVKRAFEPAVKEIKNNNDLFIYSRKPQKYIIDITQGQDPKRYSLACYRLETNRVPNSSPVWDKAKSPLTASSPTKWRNLKEYIKRILTGKFKLAQAASEYNCILSRDYSKEVKDMVGFCPIIDYRVNGDINWQKVIYTCRAYRLLKMMGLSVLKCKVKRGTLLFSKIPENTSDFAGKLNKTAVVSILVKITSPQGELLTIYSPHFCLTPAISLPCKSSIIKSSILGSLNYNYSSPVREFIDCLNEIYPFLLKHVIGLERIYYLANVKHWPYYFFGIRDEVLKRYVLLYKELEPVLKNFATQSIFGDVAFTPEGGSCLIFGEPNIGKTSVSLALKEQYKFGIGCQDDIRLLVSETDLFAGPEQSSPRWITLKHSPSQPIENTPINRLAAVKVIISIVEGYELLCVKQKSFILAKVLAPAAVKPVVERLLDSVIKKNNICVIKVLMPRLSDLKDKAQGIVDAAAGQIVKLIDGASSCVKEKPEQTPYYQAKVYSSSMEGNLFIVRCVSPNSSPNSTIIRKERSNSIITDSLSSKNFLLHLGKGRHKWTLEEVCYFLKNPPLEITNPGNSLQWLRSPYSGVVMSKVSREFGWYPLLEKAGIEPVKRKASWKGIKSGWDKIKRILPDIRIANDEIISECREFTQNEAVALLKMAVEDHSLEAKKTLLVMNIVYVKSIAAELIRNNPKFKNQLEDLIHIGLCGVKGKLGGIDRAIEIWDEKRHKKYKCKIKNYFGKCAKNTMIRFIQNENKRSKHTNQKEERRATKIRIGNTLKEILLNKALKYAYSNNMEEIKKALEEKIDKKFKYKLKKVNRNTKILFMYIFEEKTPKELKIYWNLSQIMISYILRRYITAPEEILEEDYGVGAEELFRKKRKKSPRLEADTIRDSLIKTIKEKGISWKDAKRTMDEVSLRRDNYSEYTMYFWLWLSGTSIADISKNLEIKRAIIYRAVNSKRRRLQLLLKTQSISYRFCSQKFLPLFKSEQIKEQVKIVTSARASDHSDKNKDNSGDNYSSSPAVITLKVSAKDWYRKTDSELDICVDIRFTRSTTNIDFKKPRSYVIGKSTKEKIQKFRGDMEKHQGGKVGETLPELAELYCLSVNTISEILHNLCILSKGNWPAKSKKEVEKTRDGFIGRALLQGRDLKSINFVKENEILYREARKQGVYLPLKTAHKRMYLLFGFDIPQDEAYEFMITDVRLKEAWRRLKGKYHPDRAGRNERKRLLFDAWFKHANFAYNRLQQRRAYQKKTGTAYFPGIGLRRLSEPKSASIISSPTASPITSLSPTSLIALALGMLIGYYQDEIPFILNRIRKELSELKRTIHQGLKIKIKKYLTNSDKNRDNSGDDNSSSPVKVYQKNASDLKQARFLHPYAGLLNNFLQDIPIVQSAKRLEMEIRLRVLSQILIGVDRLTDGVVRSDYEIELEFGKVAGETITIMLRISIDIAKGEVCLVTRGNPVPKLLVNIDKTNIGRWVSVKDLKVFEDGRAVNLIDYIEKSFSVFKGLKQQSLEFEYAFEIGLNKRGKLVCLPLCEGRKAIKGIIFRRINNQLERTATYIKEEIIEDEARSVKDIFDTMERALLERELITGHSHGFKNPDELGKEDTLNLFRQTIVKKFCILELIISKCPAGGYFIKAIRVKDKTKENQLKGVDAFALLGRRFDLDSFVEKVLKSPSEYLDIIEGKLELIEIKLGNSSPVKITSPQPVFAASPVEGIEKKAQVYELFMAYWKVKKKVIATLAKALQAAKDNDPNVYIFLAKDYKKLRREWLEVSKELLKFISVRKSEKNALLVAVYNLALEDICRLMKKEYFGPELILYGDYWFGEVIIATCDEVLRAHKTFTQKERNTIRQSAGKLLAIVGEIKQEIDIRDLKKKTVGNIFFANLETLLPAELYSFKNNPKEALQIICVKLGVFAGKRELNVDYGAITAHRVSKNGKVLDEIETFLFYWDNKSSYFEAVCLHEIYHQLVLNSILCLFDRENELIPWALFGTKLLLGKGRVPKEYCKFIVIGEKLQNEKILLPQTLKSVVTQSKEYEILLSSWERDKEILLNITCGFTLAGYFKKEKKPIKGLIEYGEIYFSKKNTSRIKKGNESEFSSPVASPIEKDEKDARFILFAEDNRQLRRRYKELLEGWGYKVMTAKNGLEAWNLFSTQGHKFSLVITDLDMPCMTGEELITNIRQRLPQTKILALIARGYAGDFENSPDYFLSKYKFESNSGLLKEIVLKRFGIEPESISSPMTREDFENKIGKIGTKIGTATVLEASIFRKNGRCPYFFIRRFDVIAVKYGAVYFDKKIKQPATAWIELDPAKSNIESGRLFIDPRLGY